MTRKAEHQGSSLVTLTYRSDIDGLRAVAVLSVVAYHAFPELLPGGFVGVDIFFVISGFLISSIILKSLKENTFSFRLFYERRIKRIFPALLLVLIFCLALGWLVLLPNEYGALGEHVAAGAGFIANVLLWTESGYFDKASELKPLLHLWSLGIEEQFYIIWPLLLATVSKKRINPFYLLFFLFVASFVINLYLTCNSPPASTALGEQFGNS
jgi:peptidoglycan/LPS O-acetylase OafA/YrhL